MPGGLARRHPNAPSFDALLKQVKNLVKPYEKNCKALRKSEQKFQAGERANSGLNNRLEKHEKYFHELWEKLDGIRVHEPNGAGIILYPEYNRMMVDAPHNQATAIELSAELTEKNYSLAQCDAYVVHTADKAYGLHLKASDLHKTTVQWITNASWLVGYGKRKNEINRDEGICAANALLALHNKFLHLQEGDQVGRQEVLAQVIAVFKEHEGAILSLDQQANLSNTYQPTNIDQVFGYKPHTWGNIMADLVHDAVKDSSTPMTDQEKLALLETVKTLVGYEIGETTINVSDHRKTQADVKADIEQKA